MATANRWRLVLLALCALGLVQLSISAFNELTHFAAIPGLVYNGVPGEAAAQRSTGTPFVDRLTFPRSSPLWQQGLHSGDLVDLRRLTAAERYRFTTRWWWTGERVVVPVIRNGVALNVALTPRKYDFAADWQVANVGLAWLLLFAALIGWRRPDSAEARVLALLLIAYNVGLSFQAQNWVTPWPAFDMALMALSQPLYFGAVALFSTYSLLFARPPDGVRRVANVVAWSIAAIASAWDIVSITAPYTMIADPYSPFFTGRIWTIVVWVLPFVVPLAGPVLAIRAAKGAERARLVWASAPLGVFFVSFAVQSLPLLIDPAARIPYFVELFGSLVIFIAPLGLTYSLLNRRLLDIGFVVNRAMVYSVVSLTVVGLFVLFEWLLSELFSEASHVTNLTISAAFALFLGLSVQPIRTYADRALDTLFFRKRHEDERAIRTFAREVAYITDPATVVQRTCAILEKHADASFVTIALADDDFNGAGENDPAIVTMRASHAIVDIDSVETRLQGDFAYPMIARGRLVGALVVGPKRNDEAYAPDESDAILQVAHGVGGALDILQIQREKTDDSLAGELSALSLLVSDGFKKINERLDAKELL